MTEKKIIRWIYDNLREDIFKAIAGTRFTEDWLAGMAMREVGLLIARYADLKYRPENIHPLMKGDYSQRKGELEKSYHGFGYWQIDIGSYPEFVKSGAWKNPLITANMAVNVLTEKAHELAAHGITSDEAITAAYNCGSYNVRKGLEKSGDVDLYTHQHNYSKEVRRFRDMYTELLKTINEKV